MPTTRSATDALTGLTGDLVAAAWLLPEWDPLRAYLSMLAALPPEEDAWLEVLAPWLGELRRGLRPPLTGCTQHAAVGAAAVSALRAAKELPHDTPLARALTDAARWGFFLVRPGAA